LQAGVTKVINRIIAGRDSFITILAKNIETVLGAEFDMDTDDIDTKLGILQDEIMRLATSKSDYNNLAAEIHRLRSIKQDTQEHNAQRQTKRQRISEMTEFLAMQSGIITEYDDKFTRQLIEKITVFEGKILVEFKSGVDIEVEI
jgi:site-specific DNA recombinase